MGVPHSHLGRAGGKHLRDAQEPDLHRVLGRHVWVFGLLLLSVPPGGQGGLCASPRHLFILPPGGPATLREQAKRRYTSDALRLTSGAGDGESSNRICDAPARAWTIVGSHELLMVRRASTPVHAQLAEQDVGEVSEVRVAFAVVGH